MSGLARFILSEVATSKRAFAAVVTTSFISVLPSSSVIATTSVLSVYEDCVQYLYYQKHLNLLCC